MPVPLYFNGSKNKLGKGTWKLNKDYPSEYLKILKMKILIFTNEKKCMIG